MNLCYEFAYLNAYLTMLVALRYPRSGEVTRKSNYNRSIHDFCVHRPGKHCPPCRSSSCEKDQNLMSLTLFHIKLDSLALWHQKPSSVMVGTCNLPICFTKRFSHGFSLLEAISRRYTSQEIPRPNSPSVCRQHTSLVPRVHSNLP